ncbi:MAG: ARMT1-like domain-containing protein [Pseudomonadota bacterium]
MRPMEIRPQCRACLERLVHLTADLATTDATLKRQAAAAALEIVAQDFSQSGAIPALIASRFHRAIQEISGNRDPFAPRKALETAYLARMQRRLAPASGDDLVSALKLAALGNAVDFFRTEAEVTRELLNPVEFAVADLAELHLASQGAKGLLLYLADNAGEQFFDLPLVAHLRRQGWGVVYVVKGGPIQNDLTRGDLYGSGLGEALEPVTDTGARTVGLDLRDVSAGFRAHFEAAQIILAKGMGHFETMSHLGDPRVFYLLQAKCTAVARALEVDRGAFVFARQK